VLKFKDRSASVKEVDEIMKDINGIDKTLQKDDAAHSKMHHSETKTSYDKDPRNRIVKMTPEQKAQMDDVLAKMFGGRKNR
jgi:hypothetical protein